MGRIISGNAALNRTFLGILSERLLCLLPWLRKLGSSMSQFDDEDDEDEMEETEEEEEDDVVVVIKADRTHVRSESLGAR